jgi:S1-C subfamily serine protease
MDLEDASRPDGDASNDEPVNHASRFADVVVPSQGMTVKRIHLVIDSWSSSRQTLHFTEAKSWAAYRAVIHFSVDSAHLDHRHPWKTLKTRSSSGTGFYIGDRRIITNCHVIRDATSIRLTRNGQPGSFKGRVLCKSDICDLALVTVDNESFWNGLPVVEFETEIPALGDAVIAVGYPLGAKAVSITRGVVSGISLSDLSLMNRNPRLMRIQIDAAINPGNSGGPVLNIDTKRVVGVAFSAISSAQSMSFIISNSVLNLFLKRYEADQRTEFGLLPESGFVCAELANQSMRQFYFRERCIRPIEKVANAHNLFTHLFCTRYNDQNHFGCLIMYVERFTPAAELLCVGDVLISVDGCDVSDTGEVLFRGHEWLPYEYLVTSRSFGDSVRLQVLRRSESGTMSVIDIALPLVVPRPMLHKLEGVDFQPHWVIIGGLVFVRCCLPLLASMEKHETRAMNAGFGGAVIERKLLDEEIIVVAGALFSIAL